MHKFARKAVVVAAATSAAFGLAITSTSAAPQATWTVAPGGAVTAHADNPSVVTDSGEFKCTSADGTGSVKSGSGLSGTGIGQINSLSFAGCSAMGINITITTSGLPYGINITGESPDNPDHVLGEIANVKAHVSGFGCSADFTGTVHGYFDNTQSALIADGTSRDLTASNASCLGIINNGDTVALKAVVKMSPGQTITAD
ncbi:hypothetical protein HUT18_18940 [Streptomyces sp. NA04227]|uniref:hypothetical protein n=1 Tax=Streptomyces sp. NA04227 TaxID=2742136 RepID=UPI00159170A0|nr:hypothetical protein [Streptomyces sp. NA04227]QKW08142.1 hypothetical protein HUT18_18940 [Streptomyces sp. NA04227]